MTKQEAEALSERDSRYLAAMQELQEKLHGRCFRWLGVQYGGWETLLHHERDALVRRYLRFPTTIQPLKWGYKRRLHA